MKLFILSILICSPICYAVADSETNKKGYWWGEPVLTEEEQAQQQAEDEKNQQRTLPPLPPMSELMEMHPEEMRALEKQYLDQALWKLTPEATEQYYTLLKAVRLKAKAFAATHGIVKMTNPELSTSYELPTMTAGRAVKQRETEAAIANKIQQYQNKYGLIMFTSRTCSYCPSQRYILKEFSKKYQLFNQEVDINLFADMALKFNIKNTPTIILVEKGSQNWLPVTHGLQSLPVLRNNAYRSIMMLENELDPRQFYTPPNLLGTNLDPNQYKGNYQ